jgi:hypothetical protein
MPTGEVMPALQTPTVRKRTGHPGRFPRELCVTYGRSCEKGFSRSGQPESAATPSSPISDDAEQESVSPLAPDIDVVAKDSLLMHAVLRQHRD